MTTTELYEKLVSELDRSLVVDDKTRDYWIKNYKAMPVSAVELFYENLAKANSHVDDMIAAGIDADPQLGEQIIQKGKNIKKKTFQLKEKESVQEENPEEFLKASLQ